MLFRSPPGSLRRGLPVSADQAHGSITAPGSLPIMRIVLLGACLVLFAALYFGMLWLMGFKYAYFKRRVK